MKELFKIESKNIYYKTSGELQAVAEYILIRPLPYTLFSSNVSAYVEFLDMSKQKIFDGFNKNIPTPENWGTDDNVVINAFAEALKVVILPEELETSTE